MNNDFKFIPFKELFPSADDNDEFEVLDYIRSLNGFTVTRTDGNFVKVGFMTVMEINLSLNYSDLERLENVFKIIKDRYFYAKIFYYLNVTVTSELLKEMEAVLNDEFKKVEYQFKEELLYFLGIRKIK